MRQRGPIGQEKRTTSLIIETVDEILSPRALRMSKEKKTCEL